ncbi:hypothetical protein [Vagococcus acidifermentans]|uniref:Uncharacterized protein n=1 Tax=Vagococcus acidifermentans TaxID=564710 RepID=A0A430AZA8_9ENTE|nr:hypothetical protein [Vagococcus acidifermentans]RSU13401.1 hypothetical protein CBF27_04275 [Vagococcus acidifermentans]
MNKPSTHPIADKCRLICRLQIGCYTSALLAGLAGGLLVNYLLTAGAFILIAAGLGVLFAASHQAKKKH